MRNLEKTLQALYNSEINFSISCFWDGGFDIKLGDEMNGFKAETNVGNIEDAAETLYCLVEQYYPDSDYIKSAWHPISTSPKDGTFVQIYGGHFFSNTQLHGFSVDEHNPVLAKYHFSNERGEFWVLAEEEEIGIRNPTHWRTK